MDSFAFQGTFSKVWRWFLGLSRWRSGKEPACPCRRYKKERVKSLSRVRLFATPWTVAHQAPLSMAFSRQEYWNGLPFPSPGDIADPGIKPRFPTLQADALPLSHQGRYKRRSLLWGLGGLCGGSVTGKDATKHPTMHRTASTTKNYPASRFQ